MGMHEGDFWKFKCTYKYNLNDVDRYKYVAFFDLPQIHGLTRPTSILAQNGLQHGRIELCTLLTSTRKILQTDQSFKTSCIPLFPHTQLRITYVAPSIPHLSLI
jgi:hypothetical protein